MSIDYNRKVSPPAPFLKIDMSHPLDPSNRFSVEAKLDTGADITALPSAFIEEMDLQQINILDVIGYSGERLQVPTYKAVVEIEGTSLHIEVIGYSDTFALLGRDVLNRFRLLLDGPALTLEILPLE